MTIEQKIQEASDMTLPYSVRKQIAQAINTWLKDEIVPEERYVPESFKSPEKGYEGNKAWNSCRSTILKRLSQHDDGE